MYQSIFGYRWINGYKVDIFGWDDKTEQILYYVCGSYKTRKAKRHYTRAALGLGGNPFPGTRLEWYDIILPNGKKARYNIYA